MERQAKDGTFYRKVGADDWEPITRASKDGTIYKKIGADEWAPAGPVGEKYKPAEVAVMHGLQGATGNFLDEISGVGEAAGRAVGVKGLGGKFSDLGFQKPTLANLGDNFTEQFGKDYEEGRDKKRRILAEQAKEHPATSTIANVTGAVVSPLNKIAKGASIAKSGAAIGGITAAGASEADTLGGLALDTGLGIATGGIVGKVADKAAPVIQRGAQNIKRKVSEKSKDLAERFAARAIGAERGTITKFGQDKVQEAGRQALDEGIITPLGSTDRMVKANEAVKTMAAESRKAAYKSIDDKAASEFNPLDVATKTEAKVIGGKDRSHDDIKELAQTLEPHLANILSRGDGNISMAKAQELVEALGKKARFDGSRSTQANEVAKDVYNTVRQAINEAAEKGADKVGISGLRETIESANKTYARGATASALLKKKVAREQGNKIIGLTDAITGAGATGYGATTGDWETAAAIVGGKKVLQKYGAQNAALALNKFSKSLLKAPEMAGLAQKSPAVFQAIALKLEGKSAALPPAADEGPSPKLKGEEKWVVDGFSKIQKHGNFALNDPALVGKLLQSAKGKRLLIAASDLKPGSKAMNVLVKDLKSAFSEEQK